MLDKVCAMCIVCTIIVAASLFESSEASTFITPVLTHPGKFTHVLYSHIFTHYTIIDRAFNSWRGSHHRRSLLCTLIKQFCNEMRANICKYERSYAIDRPNMSISRIRHIVSCVVECVSLDCNCNCWFGGMKCGPVSCEVLLVVCLLRMQMFNVTDDS